MKDAWIQTRAGRAFALSDPKAEDVDPADLAFALARICRFTGHVEHYSVAQHSVLVSREVRPDHAAWGLLHDAAEAYVGDVSYPVKLYLRDKGCNAYDELEDQVARAVSQRFGVYPYAAIEEAVKRADLVLLATEARDLLGEAPREWESLRDVAPLELKILRWTAEVAEERFLARGQELGLW